jgi:hypothetical protein
MEANGGQRLKTDGRRAQPMKAIENERKRSRSFDSHSQSETVTFHGFVCFAAVLDWLHHEV